MWPLLCIFVGGAAFAVRRGLRLAAHHALQQQQQQALGRAARGSRAGQGTSSSSASSTSSGREASSSSGNSSTRSSSETQYNTTDAENAQDLLFRRLTDKVNSWSAQWQLMTRDVRGFENPMSKAEAYQILRLTPAASKEKVLQTHKQLMLRNHPDNGGSTYVATKVNEAKDKLLKP